MTFVMDPSTPLEAAIARTVRWFSLFDTPVTGFEVWKWLLGPDRPYRLEEVLHALDTSEWLRERIWSAGGFFEPAPELSSGVAGAEQADAPHVPRSRAPERRARFLDAERKYKAVRRAARFMSRLPTVEMVAAGNTLAWWNTRPDSDIDLFVVARPGTIWLTRLLLVAPFALLGMRPGRSAEAPFCFSFFVTADAMDLSSLRLAEGDPYLAYWARSLVPIIDRNGTFERFQRANAWAASDLPHAEGKCAPMWAGRGFSGRGRVGRVAERFAKWAQMRRLPERIRSMMNRDSRVVVSDSVLKFHDNDRRAEYRDRLRSL